MEVQIVLGLLQSDGFTAQSDGDFLIGGVGELPATGLYVLRVPEREYQAANKLVIEYENGDLKFDFEDYDT